ncbi:MAG: nitrophenyl compound nitroreductase subunit ArsF family protein [Candidatus Omnitrophica bacterium]|nr:nitrophenyl compound nitroreductase subunit ArsF family protein [Candidatus Omnitrophota bacterium]
MFIKRIFAPVILVTLLTIVTTSVFSANTKIITYYFHGNVRCPTCHKMEQYTKEAIEENFKDELANGLLVFKAVNVDEKENEHFISDYQLYTQSLIISYIENGKETQHKNLTKIWEYAGDKKRFFSYVTTGISGYLKDVQG